MDSYIFWGLSLLGAAIVVITPIIKLNTAISKLIVSLSVLSEELAAMRTKNSEDHGKFFKRIEHLENDVTELKTKVQIYHNP